MDVAEQAAGGVLDTSRWLGGVEDQANSFRTAYREAINVEVIKTGPLWSIAGERRMVVIGHPLWARPSGRWNSDQRAAAAEAPRALPVIMSDVRELAARPDRVFAGLVST
jgi:hypothetical protein